VADHPPAPSTLDAIAASFLRSSADTLTARSANGMAYDTNWLDAVAERIGVPPLARAEELQRVRSMARSAHARAIRAGQSLLTLHDPAYPPLLRQIADPPLVLWYQGDTALLPAPAVAVVGARDASPAGLYLARQLGRDLAAAGLVVVSGMARGVDAAAHEGALTAGKTVAVLGSGVDVTYPPEHRALQQQISATGVVISELPPGTPSLPYHFPLRNRIISGLSRAVVVIEAGEKSGSLITARMALEQNRDVLAVPGNPASGFYRGSHRLIKDGARLVESVEDVLDELGWKRPERQESKFQVRNGLEAEFTPGEPLVIEDLVARTGRAASDLLAELSVLELAGRVARVSGGGFVRLD
jgi:DNA processing protein